MPETALAPHWTDAYTSEQVDPVVRKLCVDMLVDPKNTYTRIQEVTGLSPGSIKAIQRREQEPIAERKAKLLRKSLLIAEDAADLIHQKLGQAPINMLVPIYGCAADKVRDLTASEQPTATIKIDISIQDIYSDFRSVQDRIADSIQSLPSANPIPKLSELGDSELNLT